MDIVIASAGFGVAAACAGLMGFAIQRGATCMVAAVDEVVTRRRGGLLVANAIGFAMVAPAGYRVGVATVVGGALLGVGAFVNRACVFGAIARFGSGEWAYLATPIGFYAGCVVLPLAFAMPAPVRLAEPSPVLQPATWFAAAAALAMIARIALGIVRIGRERSRDTAGRLGDAVARRVWSPHGATAVIGVTFVVMVLVVGAWAWTDALAELARGMSRNALARSALLLALLGGAVVGGASAGRFRSTPPTPARVARCFLGGTLMAWGTLLIPGSNDGLILIGMPLLWPYAWVAFLSMALAIALAQALERPLGMASARDVARSGH